MKKCSSFLGLGFALQLCFASAYADDQHHAATINRQLLLKQTVTLPSNQIDAKVFRVQFPQGYKTPAHTHDGPGPRYVVKGKLRVVDGGNSQVFSAGQIFWETGELMTVENIGQGEAEIIIFEMAPLK